MGAYCLTEGRFVKAAVGEVFGIKEFTHAGWVVVNQAGDPVCVPHDGAKLQMVTVAPRLAGHRVLRTLRAGQTVDYQIVNRNQAGKEQDVITTKTGKTADLGDLIGCTFVMTEEKQEDTHPGPKPAMAGVSKSG
jgi:hypothetical protein